MPMVDSVQMAHDPDLVCILDALAIPWVEDIPTNGTSGTILVQIDTAADGRLESLVGALSEIRWKYEPGRRLQLALDLPGI